MFVCCAWLVVGWFAVGLKFSFLAGVRSRFGLCSAGVVVDFLAAVLVGCRLCVNWFAVGCVLVGLRLVVHWSSDWFVFGAWLVCGCSLFNVGCLSLVWFVFGFVGGLASDFLFGGLLVACILSFPPLAVYRVFWLVSCCVLV